MKVPERLETKRLILRPYSEENNIPFLDNYRYTDPGFSLVIYSKVNDAYLGICGLNPIKDSNRVGLIIALLPEFRGNGYAIEALLKLIEFSFSTLNILEIIAYIHPDNTHGWKVAERIGMKYMGQIQHKDFIPKAMLFTLKRREYTFQHSY